MNVAAVCMLVIGIFLLVISAIIFANSYIGVDASVAKWETQYESLTYQLENNLYDNDNDIGKKELMDEIREWWNGDLAYHKKIQRNFWVDPKILSLSLCLKILKASRKRGFILLYIYCIINVQKR